MGRNFREFAQETLDEKALDITRKHEHETVEFAYPKLKGGLTCSE